MTDARFPYNNSVICKVYRVKFKMLVQDCMTHQRPNAFRNRSRGSPLQREYLPKNGNFWYFGDRVPTLVNWLKSNFTGPSVPTCQIFHKSVQRVVQNWFPLYLDDVNQRRRVIRYVDMSSCRWLPRHMESSSSNERNKTMPRRLCDVALHLRLWKTVDVHALG